MTARIYVAGALVHPLSVSPARSESRKWQPHDEHAALAGAGGGVVYADREGVIRLWNRGAETIFGYRRQDALGQTLDLIIPEPWRVRHWKGYRTVMQTGVTRYGNDLLTVPASRSDGTRISIEFSIILPTDRDGRVLGAVAVVRDVTARREQEQALRKRLAVLEAAARGPG